MFNNQLSTAGLWNLTMSSILGNEILPWVLHWVVKSYHELYPGQWNLTMSFILGSEILPWALYWVVKSYHEFYTGLWNLTMSSIVGCGILPWVWNLTMSSILGCEILPWALYWVVKSYHELYAGLLSRQLRHGFTPTPYTTATPTALRQTASWKNHKTKQFYIFYSVHGVCSTKCAGRTFRRCGTTNIGIRGSSHLCLGGGYLNGWCGTPNYHSRWGRGDGRILREGGTERKTKCWLGAN
jgi:hypothetical protein